MISTPVMAEVRKAEGPVSEITVPEPTNSPAPITPPMAIMVRCRCLRPFLSSVGGAAPIASPRGGRVGQHPTSALWGMTTAAPHATADAGHRPFPVQIPPRVGHLHDGLRKGRDPRRPAPLPGGGRRHLGSATAGPAPPPPPPPRPGARARPAPVPPPPP